MTTEQWVNPFPMHPPKRDLAPCPHEAYFLVLVDAMIDLASGPGLAVSRRRGRAQLGRVSLKSRPSGSSRSLAPRPPSAPLHCRSTLTGLSAHSSLALAFASSRERRIANVARLGFGGLARPRLCVRYLKVSGLTRPSPTAGSQSKAAKAQIWR